MNLKIVNQTYDDSLKIAFNGELLCLEAGQTVTVTASQPTGNISVIPSEENQVLINWLFAKLDGFIDADHVINSLVCTADAVISSTDDNAVLVLKDLRYRDDKYGYIYDSVYFDCHFCDAAAVVYHLKDFTAAKKRAWRLYVFLFSLLPFYIVDFALTLWLKDLWFLAPSVLFVFLFSIPSFKRAAKLKVFYSDAYADSALKEKAETLKMNDGEEVSSQPTDFIGRFVYKTMDCIFNRNKK